MITLQLLDGLAVIERCCLSILTNGKYATEILLESIDAAAIEMDVVYLGIVQFKFVIG